MWVSVHVAPATTKKPWLGLLKLSEKVLSCEIAGLPSTWTLTVALVWPDGMVTVPDLGR